MIDLPEDTYYAATMVAEYAREAAPAPEGRDAVDRIMGAAAWSFGFVFAAMIGAIAFGWFS